MTFLIFDPSINESYALMILQKYFAQNQSLFKGTKDEVLENVSPWIFRIENNFSEVINNESGLSLVGSVFIECDSGMEAIVRHLQQFIYQVINGREYFFRFWDGRVLKKFLPTCSPVQLKEIFGPLKIFATDSESPEHVAEFLYENGFLITRKIPKQEFLNKLIGMKGVPEISSVEKSVVVQDEKKDKPGRKWNFLID